MNYTLAARLIAKDWYLSRLPLTIIAIVGAAATGLLFLGNELGLVGIITSLISLIFLSVLVPQITVINERKNQNLPFVMSLPISPHEYTLSKVLGNLGAFLVLWLAIAGTVLATINASGVGRGILPLGVIAALCPLVSFSLLLSVAIVSESELWSSVTMAGTNVAYSFWWFLFKLPGFGDNLKSPVPVWSTGVLTVIGAQLAICVAAFALTFILQARKRSFL